MKQLVLVDLLAKIAPRYDLDPKLVRAIIQVESAGDANAYRYEPRWRWLVDRDGLGIAQRADLRQAGTDAIRDTAAFELGQTELSQQSASWGLMQVMGSVARELGGKWPYLSVLCQPALGIQYGCIYLEKMTRRFPAGWDAVAAYNAGSPRRDADGEYVNRGYVEKVRAAM